MIKSKWRGVYSQLIDRDMEIAMWFDRSYKDDERDCMEPTKQAKPHEDLYAKGEYRASWRTEHEYDGPNMTVYFAGFEASIHHMQDCGWDIALEYNRFTGKHKLCFRNKESGLMARVPYVKDGMTHIQLDRLYAVKNYRIKAAKFEETKKELDISDIPAILEWIREVKAPVIGEILWERHREKARNKVIELGEYLMKQTKKVA